MGTCFLYGNGDDSTGGGNPVISSATCGFSFMSFETDTLLNTNASKENFIVKRGSEIVDINNVKIDGLTGSCSFTNKLSSIYSMTIQIKGDAFLYPKSDTDATRASLFSIPYGTTSGMTNANYANDDGTTTLSMPDGAKWQYNLADVSTLYISGNSWIGLNSSSELIRVNRIDSYINTYYYSVEHLGAGLTALKIRWEGWAPYNYRTDPYKYTYEVFLFSNGDCFIYLCDKGDLAIWSGKFIFCGVSFTLNTSSPYVSFYRRSVEGTSSSHWEVAYEEYDLSKSLNLI